MEREALVYLRGLEQSHIVATGGASVSRAQYGVPSSFRLRNLLNPDRSILIDRLQQMRANRPMLNQISAEKLPVHIDQLMAKRLPFYQRAHVTLSAGELSADRLVQIALQDAPPAVDLRD